MSVSITDPNNNIFKFLNGTLFFCISTENLFSLWTEENQLELRDTFLSMMRWQYNQHTKICSYPYEMMVKDCEGYTYICLGYSHSNISGRNLFQQAYLFCEPDPCIFAFGKAYALDSPEPVDLGGSLDYISYLQHRYKGIVSIERGEGQQRYLFNKVTLPKGALHT